MREVIALERDLLKELGSAQPGTCIIHLAGYRERFVPAFHIREEEKVLEVLFPLKKNIGYLLNAYAIREGKVLVIFYHLRFMELPEIVYESTLNPADRDMREILVIQVRSEICLTVFVGKGGKVRKVVGISNGRLRNFADRVLNKTREGEWSVEEFLSARERIFSSYPVERLQQIAGFKAEVVN